MRHVYIALIVLLTAVVLLFKFQNLDSVTISLLGTSATLPLSTLVILVYVLGMVTGSACLAWSGVGSSAPRGRLDRSHGIVCRRQSDTARSPISTRHSLGEALVRRIEGATGSQERHDNDATPRIAGGS